MLVILDMLIISFGCYIGYAVAECCWFAPIDEYEERFGEVDRLDRERVKYQIRNRVF